MPEIECGFSSGARGNGTDLLVLYGPTVEVQIGLDRSYRVGESPHPNLREEKYLALVDTGASLSCIDSDLATTLQLPVVDRRHVSGVHGQLEVNVHLAQVCVPSLGVFIYGQFCGVHLARGGQPHLALLGRHFLRDFTMSYDGRTGSVKIIRPAT